MYRDEVRQHCCAACASSISTVVLEYDLFTLVEDLVALECSRRPFRVAFITHYDGKSPDYPGRELPKFSK